VNVVDASREEIKQMHLIKIARYGVVTRTATKVVSFSNRLGHFAWWIVTKLGGVERSLFQNSILTTIRTTMINRTRKICSVFVCMNLWFHFYRTKECLVLENVSLGLCVICTKAYWVFSCLSFRPEVSWHGYVLHQGTASQGLTPAHSHCIPLIAHIALCHKWRHAFYVTRPLLCARITCYVTVITE
jgi:hypothetical protein